MRIKFLIIWLIFISLFASCSDDELTPKNIKTEYERDSVERELFAAINQYRLGKGLPALTDSEIIREVAREHSENMLEGEAPLGHKDFDKRIARLEEDFEILASSENVANAQTNINPAPLVLNKWLEDDECRARIEGDFNVAGVGVARDSLTYYITQILIKEKM